MRVFLFAVVSFLLIAPPAAGEVNLKDPAGLDMNSNILKNVPVVADPSAAMPRNWIEANDQDTNASTECSGAQYLSGDGSCDLATDDQNLQPTSRSGDTVTIPIESGSSTDFTDRSAEEACSSGEFLSGGGSCDSNPGSDRYIGNGGSHSAGGHLDMNSHRIEYLDVLYFGDPFSVDTPFINHDSSNGELELVGRSNVTLWTWDTGLAKCWLNEVGTWNCEGAKNFVHQLNSTHEAFYSSQESGDVRAVIEGTGKLESGEKEIELPSHFSGVISEKNPDLKVQVTPRSTDTYGLAVPERSTDSIVVEELKGGNSDLKFDYRITGIREGFEDKKVVRN